MNVLFYVDPDERDTNNDASEALLKEKFLSDKFQSVGIMNMGSHLASQFCHFFWPEGKTEALSDNHLCAGLQESAGKCLEDCRRQQ